MKKISKQTAGSLAAVLCAALAFTGCGSAAKETDTAQEEEVAVTVSTQTVEAGSITLNNSFVGTISPEETVAVIPLAAGTVTNTYFEVGDNVNAGDVLFQIDDEAARLQLEQAQLNALSTKQQADATLTTQQDSTNLQLESSKIQAQSSQIQAQSGYEQAQIAYVSAKDAYEDLDNQWDDVKGSLSGLESSLASAQSELETVEKQIAAQQKATNKATKEEEEEEEENSESETASTYDEDNTLEELNSKKTSLESQIKQLKSSISDINSLKTSRDSLYDQYLTAQSAYKIADQSRDIADRSMDIVDETIDLTQGQALEDTQEALQTGIDLVNVSVEQAEMALSYYTVKAPVSGVIESKNVDVNGMAAQGTPAYTIVNNNTMTVTFNVSEAVKNTLSVGQQIILERNSDTYSASITEIGSSVNAQTGLFQIKACVEADGTKLPSGVSVKITADTYQASNALIIPYDSVYYENEGAYVYISVDGRAVKRPITTGIFDDDNIEVTDGLQAGDIVVTSWSPQLTEGVLLHAVENDGNVTSDSDAEKTQGEEAAAGTEDAADAQDGAAEE